MADYYELLGVSKTASDAEIKSAYRKKALEWHPDRNKTAGASDKFKEINKAYEVLSDPQKKQMYDQYGESAFTGAGGGRGAPGGGSQYYSNMGGQGFNVDFDFGDFSNPFDIFEQFFGFNSQYSGNGRQRAPHPVYQITITFDEAVKGTEKTLSIKSGSDKKVKIPAGVDDGMRIRFSDFDVLIRVNPDSKFKREGQDIYYEAEISYPQAVLGDVIEVPTIDEPVKIKVKAGTGHGAAVRLKGQGVPYPQAKQRGDQYVIFKIKIPQKVSGKSKKLIEELKNELK